MLKENNENAKDNASDGLLTSDDLTGLGWGVGGRGGGGVVDVCKSTSFDLLPVSVPELEWKLCLF